MKIVRISALWCSACLITNPRFDEIIKNYSDIEVTSYDYDFDDISNYNVGSIIPVFILYKDDVEIGRLIGEKTKDEITNFIESGR